VTSSIAIDTLSIGVPVKHQRNRRKPAEPETIHLEVRTDELWVWDDGHQLASEIFTFPGHTAESMFRDIAEVPHLDEIFRAVTEHQVANRANLVGAHLEPAVQATEMAIAARDGSSVYFADASGQMKIGWSKKVGARIAQLQTGSAVPIKLLGTMAGGRALERRLHDQFAHLRLSGEWFVAAPELLDFVAREAK
jgi:hypothetical protein